jgi:L-iditol 2-dehydrogenase
MAPPAALAEVNGNAPQAAKDLSTVLLSRVAKTDADIIATPYANPSLQTTADHQLKQVETSVREPKRGEVLLHVKATGVCG